MPQDSLNGVYPPPPPQCHVIVIVILINTNTHVYVHDTTCICTIVHVHTVDVHVCNLVLFCFRQIRLNVPIGQLIYLALQMTISLLEPLSGEMENEKVK